jgi:hypothetical protein
MKHSAASAGRLLVGPSAVCECPPHALSLGEGSWKRLDY